MVTVETAMAIPAVLAMAGVALWGIGAASAAVALSDAGRSAARDLARGVPQAQVLEQVRLSIPESRTEVEVGAREVTVRVHRFFDVPIPLLSGLGLDLSSSFVAPLEWMGFDA